LEFQFPNKRDGCRERCRFLRPVRLRPPAAPTTLEFPTNKPMTRKGKIARLPEEIREIINQQISDNIALKRIAAEINARPGIAEILQPHFKNRTITESNLSEWKLGGYLEWRSERAAKSSMARIMSANDTVLDAAQSRLSDRIAVLLASHMIAEIKQLENTTRTEEKIRLWRELRLGLSAMKRYEFFSLKHKQEMLKMEKQKVEEQTLMTLEEKEARINEIMGLDDERTYKDFLTATWRGPEADEMNRQDDQLIAAGNIPPREQQIAEYKLSLEAEQKRREREPDELQG